MSTHLPFFVGKLCLWIAMKLSIDLDITFKERAIMADNRIPYQRFFDSYIDPAGIIGAGHDGLNHKIFAELNDTEIQAAEDALLSHLPDWRAVQGLGALRSQKAIEPLRKLETQLYGSELIQLELALKHIGAESTSAGQRIIGILLPLPSGKTYPQPHVWMLLERSGNFPPSKRRGRSNRRLSMILSI